MSMMMWNDKLETGIPKIDEQHKELFRQVAILLDKTTADRIPETLKFLGDYVVKHFIDEQGLQASVNYPKAEEHKKLHAAFTARFGELKKKFEDSGGNLKFEAVTEINRVAVAWLKEHIMIHDREFAAYYKQKNAAKAAMLGAARPAAPAAGPKPMPKFWRPEFNTGISKLDEQHKELFRQVEVLTDKSKTHHVPKTLKFLSEYLRQHFGAKERAQAAIDYPKAEAHKKLHIDFGRKFKELKDKYEAAHPDSKFLALEEISRVAVHWLKEHIMHQDKDFADHYKRHRSGQRGGSEKRGFLSRLFSFFGLK